MWKHYVKRELEYPYLSTMLHICFGLVEFFRISSTNEMAKEEMQMQYPHFISGELLGSVRLLRIVQLV